MRGRSRRRWLRCFATHRPPQTVARAASPGPSSSRGPTPLTVRSRCTAPCSAAAEASTMAVRRMPQLDPILFDMGGTLDGRGAWRERFERGFAEAGVFRSREERMRAFDYAEQRAHTTAAMSAARLRDHVSSHLGWQFEALRIDDGAAACAIVDRF